jgi:CelD/BcsL family acetyltransferase involved in cellulose biosynthesis
MIVDTLTRIADLEALRDLWLDLFHRCPEATPFQRPEWLLPWCRRFAPEAVRVVLVHAGGRLIGMLPLAISGSAARLLGEGITDYLDALVDPEHEREALDGFAGEIAAWSGCMLSALPPSSPLLRMPKPRDFDDVVTMNDVCPVLSLASGITHALPKEMARNLRRARARAETAGRLAFVTADAARRCELLEALFALHGARWDGGGVLGDETVRAFHREASAAMLEAGLLRLHAVTLDDRIVAVVYGFATKDALYLYLQGYDPALAALSPGTLAVGFAIEEAAREGARAVDMLRGREGYKYRFGAVDRPTWSRRIERTGALR